MTEELMTAAVCWDMDSCVSVNFAYSAKDLFYFCPDPSCLAEVVPVQINNTFFRAPKSHVSGCINEKKTTTPSSVPVAPKSRHSPLPPQIVPSHLGTIAKKRKATKPSRHEMSSLAQKIQKNSVPQHPGTLREVVDAWWLMDANAHPQQPLHIAAQDLTYSSAFGSIGNPTGDISLLNCARIILKGSASVNFFNGSYYAVTGFKFKFGDKSLPIRVRVKSDNPEFHKLANVKSVELFLHGAIPVINGQERYFEIQSNDDYTGFVIKF